MIVYPKEMIIATLRDFFSKDSYYHYSKDQWGFANTIDHTDLPLGADIPTQFNKNGANQDSISTRLFIGENYRYDGIYYPCILVKSGGSRYVPISINRDSYGIENELITYVDGYGNQTMISRPAYFYTTGAWEGSIIIDVMTRSLRSRDDLTELVAMCFTDIEFDNLEDIGIVVKQISIGGASEMDDRNDKLFRQTLTLDIRTEWKRCIPICSFIDAIFLSVQFGDLSKPEPTFAPNMTINSEISLTDMLLGIKKHS
jgi:hypothetical protein